jgi:hypothetical protein
MAPCCGPPLNDAWPARNTRDSLTPYQAGHGLKVDADLLGQARIIPGQAVCDRIEQVQMSYLGRVVAPLVRHEREYQPRAASQVNLGSRLLRTISAPKTLAEVLTALSNALFSVVTRRSRDIQVPPALPRTVRGLTTMKGP